MFRKVTAILDMRDITMTNEEWSFAAIAVEASHNDYEKRKSAARRLGYMRSNRALRLLLLLLKDSDPPPFWWTPYAACLIAIICSY